MACGQGALLCGGDPIQSLGVALISVEAARTKARPMPRRRRAAASAIGFASLENVAAKSVARVPARAKPSGDSGRAASTVWTSAAAFTASSARRRFAAPTISCLSVSVRSELQRWPASSGQISALDKWNLCRLPSWAAGFGVARREGVARPE